MKDYQRRFIELAIKNDVLKFGEFTLKSGRKSPYFFNAGAFQTSSAISELTEIYADALNEHMKVSSTKFDIVFGPAYKGIPLATGLGIHMWMKYKTDFGVTYNRKERKDHGEGGVVVGASMKGKQVFAVDDVMTAGTAIRESVTIINSEGGHLVGVLVALDRQEKVNSETTKSAIQQFKEEMSIPVIAIVTLDDIVDYISQNPKYSSTLDQISQYRALWGAS